MNVLDRLDRIYRIEEAVLELRIANIAADGGQIELNALISHRCDAVDMPSIIEARISSPTMLLRRSNNDIVKACHPNPQPTSSIRLPWNSPRALNRLRSCKNLVLFANSRSLVCWR